jgi:hypothetical protein
MNAKQRKHGEHVRQDHVYRHWKIRAMDSSDDPALVVYAEDDPYYVMEFTTRSRLMDFVKQLQRMADDVWPP